MKPIFALIFGISALLAAPSTWSAVPVWKDDPLTTFASYTFTTPSTTPAPEEVRNPYGSPMLTVNPELFFGTGWQDPNGEFQLTRVPGEGAWDLGQFGNMALTIPVAPVAGSVKDLDVFIDCVWYQGPVSIPTFGVSGLTPATLLVTQELVQPDGAGSWRRTNWDASFLNETADSITVMLQAPWNGSVVDSLTVYTRYVPEPGTATLVLLALAFAARRQRNQEQ
jgi:hypothetical protein